MKKTVELDEVFKALDPVTRKAFQNWQQSLAKSVGSNANQRGQDINDALGNLPGFAQDADGVLSVLDEQSAEVRAWSRTPVSCSARSTRTRRSCTT